MEQHPPDMCENSLLRICVTHGNSQYESHRSTSGCFISEKWLDVTYRFLIVNSFNKRITKDKQCV